MPVTNRISMFVLPTNRSLSPWSPVPTDRVTFARDQAVDAADLTKCHIKSGEHCLGIGHLCAYLVANTALDGITPPRREGGDR
ncbi:hypothetical protein ACIGXM_35685 [Kitasatospora sp. NPDC052896]|uniref:hypothetical protein n=1 Tax=Kitasatospora sp. NPDC052896 TaxID=3364061 RepID=UPI0037C85EDA